MSVRVGLAGWSYADWQGVVYPRSCPDPLRYVTRYCDLIEINSSFYRTPRVEAVASWVEKTAERGTVFSAKLPQVITHQGRLDAEEVARFRAAFAPLVESGRLRCLLAQFSHRFEANSGSLGFLRRIAAAFGSMAGLVVELRHGSWREAAASIPESFAVAQLDYPGARSGFDGSGHELRGPGGLAYFRAHGRNEAAWFAKDAGRDATYDWEYRDGELEQMLDRIRTMAQQAQETLVVANNHFHGKAMKLVLQLLADLRGETVPVPEPMVAAYPGLAAIARGGQGRLF